MMKYLTPSPSYLAGLLLVFTLPLGAQFTAEEAVSRALAAHPGIQGAKAMVEEEAAAALQAGLPPNPELEFGMEEWSLSGRGEEGGKLHAGLAQPLPLSGARKAARKAHSYGAAAAEHEVEALHREISAQALHLFYQTLAAREYAALVREEADYVESLAELTRLRFEAGDLAEVDWIRASAEHARWRAELEQANGAREALRVQLAQFCGIPETELPPCAGELAPAQEDLPQEDALYREVLDSPRNQAREQRETRARLETDAARRTGIPEPTVHAGILRERDSGAFAFQAGLRIGLPLFDRNQGATEAARAKTRRLQAERMTAEWEERRTAKALLDEVKTALSKAALLRAEVLPKQAEITVIMEQALEIGDKTLFEVLAERREMMAMRLRLLETKSTARNAWVALQALL